MLIGPANDVRKAVQERLAALGLRCVVDEGGRAESVLRTTRRVVLVLIDGRSAIENVAWVKWAKDAHPQAAIAWLPPAKNAPGELRALVTKVIDETQPQPVLRAAELTLSSALFPPKLVGVLREAAQVTLQEQFKVTLPPAPAELRGDYEPRDEVAVAVAFNSAALTGHLTLFATAVMLEELMVDAHRTRSPGEEIAVELANLVAGHMRSLLLRSLSDFSYKIPVRWSASSRASMGPPPALVLPVSRGTQRLWLELRLNHLDGEALNQVSEQTILPTGSLSFLE